MTGKLRGNVGSTAKSLVLLATVVLGLVLAPCDAKISDERSCYDKECSVVVSEGRTVLSYRSNDHEVLSFPMNALVKIFSKEAGKRTDLWGVEINGKRGYAPKKFIRETKIYQSKLEFIVPTENFNIEKDKNIQEDKKPVENSKDTIPASEHDLIKTDSSENSANENVTEAFDPHLVSPSYDSIYDGTVIPKEENLEPAPPSYSTQTLQDNVKKEEEVQLNVYPNIISSTFSAISGILSTADENSEENVEFVSSKNVLTDEIVEETPEIKKADDSSLESEETKAAVPETIVESVVNNIENNKKTDTLVEPQGYKVTTSAEADSLLEPKVNLVVDSDGTEANEGVSSSENIVSEEAVNEIAYGTDIINASQVHEAVNKNAIDALDEEEEDKEVEEKVKEVEEKVEEVEEKVEEVEVKEEKDVEREEDVKEKIEEEVEVKEEKDLKEESVTDAEKNDSPVVPKVTEIKTDLSGEPQVIEQIISESEIKKEENKNEHLKVNVVSEEKLEIASDTLNLADEIKSENPISQPSFSLDISTDKSSIHDSAEEIEPVFENLNNVPNEEKPVVVADNVVNIENDTATFVEETIVAVNTSVNSPNVEDSIIPEVPEVPLTQELKEEIVSASKEFFLQYKGPLEPKFSKNDSKPIEINDNLIAPKVLVEESNLIDNSLSVKQEVKDNLIESNNIIEENTYTTSIPTYLHNDSAVESTESSFQSADSSHENIVDIPSTPSFGEFLGNRNLLNAGKDSEEIAVDKLIIEENIQTTTSSGIEENLSNEVKQGEENVSVEELSTNTVEKIVLPQETCDNNYECSSDYSNHHYSAEKNAVTNARKMADNSETLLYVCITAVTTLLFSLGYYFIENKRRDAYLIAKINNLEKDLMVTRKECIMLDDNFKSTKTKLDSIEDESFGSNEMVLSLKSELAASENAREELEEQIASLEKELESTSEAGLELERMLREILSSQNEENNPLAQSIEDLQVRLNEQQVANESLTSALAIKTQENETLTGDLTVSLKKVEQLQTEVINLTEELKSQTSVKVRMEETFSEQVQSLELQIKTMNDDKSHLRKQLRMKELEVKELLAVVEQVNSNSLDFQKLCDFTQIRAEVNHLREERDELKMKLSDEEGAYQLLEEHVKVVREEVASLSEQCKLAEKEKKDAKTKLDVLTKFYEEREAQRQKEEALRLEKESFFDSEKKEAEAILERIQAMQNEILNYKEQVAMLTREILDQEREYKNQIAALETKAHEHWLIARQNERRLEEVKAESSQLRNRLTLVEKNISDGDPDAKMHRLQANGDTGAPGAHPLLFGTAGGETSSSPLMFTASGQPGMIPPLIPPPPVPSAYLYGPPPPFPPPPFLHPPTSSSSGNANNSSSSAAAANEHVGSRPPPLGGGRLSSPPPPSSNPAGSPPLSPPPSLMPFPPPPHPHHPPPPMFDVPPPMHHHHHHMPPPLLPPPLHHLQQQSQNAHNTWGDFDTLPPPNSLRNPSGFHQPRDQRPRNHKGSLHSSGESLDKSHHGGKA